MLTLSHELCRRAGFIRYFSRGLLVYRAFYFMARKTIFHAAGFL